MKYLRGRAIASLKGPRLLSYAGFNGGVSQHESFSRRRDLGSNSHAVGHKSAAAISDHIAKIEPGKSLAGFLSRIESGDGVEARGDVAGFAGTK